MKKFFKIFLLFFSATLFAQNVSDYKYIYVPQKFPDFKPDQYHINSVLISELKAKNYTVITENMENWPESLRQNPCNVLKAEVLNKSNLMRNRIILEIKDCKEIVLVQLEGKSMIKDFEPGFQDALKNALKKLPRSNTDSKVTDDKVSIKNDMNQVVPVKQKNLITETTTMQVPEKFEKLEQVYSNGTLNLTIISLEKNSFKLVNSDNAIPYAVFKPSTKKDVYHVQLFNGKLTLGYIEDGKIIIDLPNADGSFRKEIFEKK